jgi:hypothetical protein
VSTLPISNGRTEATAVSEMGRDEPVAGGTTVASASGLAMSSQSETQLQFLQNGRCGNWGAFSPPVVGWIIGLGSAAFAHALSRRLRERH